MSFLSEILRSEEEAHISNASTSLLEITKKLATYKTEVLSQVDEVYKKYCQWPKKNEKLHADLTQLYEDIEILKTNIDNVAKVDLMKESARIDSLKEEMEQAKIASNLLLSLTQIHEKLINIQNHKKNKSYFEAALEVNEAISLIKELSNFKLDDITESLMKAVNKEKISLLQIIREDLEVLLVMKEGKNGVLQTNVLKISKKEELKEIFNILKIFNVLQEELAHFSEFFWLYICKPIISNITNVHVHEDEDFHILTVSIKKTQLHRSYKEVFEKVLEVFQFIYSYLNFKVCINFDVVSCLGNNLKLDFAEALLKDCLGNMLPANDKQRVKYKQVIEDTKEFETKLVEFGFLKEQKNPIIDYVNNMNNLLATMRCEEYSMQAITIMKKDLHDMIEVGVHFDPINPLTGDQFPQCYVSKSCIELLNLAQEILQQALCESNFFATRLICTMQSFFYQYGSIVYAHHEKFLQNIPQQVVLFRNNCMYLAHQLAQLNECYGNRFSKEVLPVPPIFKDQPHQLRTIGGDTFLGYIELHKKSMERTLIEYKFESDQLSEIMSSDANKSIRQCLRQYELLKTVWHKILPHPVYNKTLGYLLNMFCKRLIDTVVGAPDILVKNAERMIEMFKLVLARGPKLFTDPDEVNLYVELWQKLNELVFILGANLVEITDRWEQGPLSAQFSPEEVKHLIKALFQNTDRRAQALSRIVNN